MLAENERIASQGRRVLALAQREFDPATFDPSGDLMALMQDLEMSALIGEVDPPRAEAVAAIAEAKRAGIRVRMITGDHAVTAAAIADELGIEGRAVTGAEFAAMSDYGGRQPGGRDRRDRPGGARTQGPAGRGAQAQGQHRRDDRRRRERRARHRARPTSGSRWASRAPTSPRARRR